MAKNNDAEIVKSLHHGQGKLPEAAEYVIALFAPAISMLAESRVTKEDLASTASTILTLLEQKVSKNELIQVVQICNAQQAEHAALLNAVNNLSNRVSTLEATVDKLRAGTIDMANHVDGEAEPQNSFLALNPDSL
jgi:hypothetical protein